MPKRYKKIVYLIGAGATHAEVQRVDPAILLLTKDVTDGIIKRIEKSNIKYLEEVRNELSSKCDIEHLITLYEKIGTRKYQNISSKLKELFRTEILARLKMLGPSFEPVLYQSLIDLHEIHGIKEKLSCFFSLNYDDMLDVAIQRIKNGIFYSVSVKINKKYCNYVQATKDMFPFLKLHGSFNWTKDYPLIVSSQYSIKKNDVLWIPPGAEKKTDNYPFNHLWSTAKEQFDFDILRVIGCSLNRNDWQLISLIFSLQKINNSVIEIIDYNDVGEGIRKQYPYLKIFTLSEISECRDYLSDLYGPFHKKTLPSWAIDNINRSNTKINILEWWLRAKGNELKKKNIPIATTSRVFEKFIN